LGARRPQFTGNGSVWSQVQYELRDNDTNTTTDLFRIETRCVAAKPFMEKPTEQCILPGCRRAEFFYIKNSTAEQKWEEKQPPEAVQVILQGKGTVPTSILAAIPTAMKGKDQ
jgi:hypothetical protein